ncbi:MAG: YihA family ribosome biogenesis GTP-binding protein [Deltaproteobacteria bacterium]|nr:YihA family ribosome biogenesis GTP-binding protein [Deltaproteobacteria bacterium]
MSPSLVITSAEFIKAATQPSHFPVGTLPEVAFAGRSNVGKSSLINCLVQRRKLVRTSRIPGRTQTINFFCINGAWHFVDLPGYGFAKVPERVRAAWRPMVEAYLTARANLRGIVQIMDARHPPTADDLQLWIWLRDRRIPSIAVLTKVDKVPRSRRQAKRREAASNLGIEDGAIVLFSSETGEGREELLHHLARLIGLFSDSPESI